MSTRDPTKTHRTKTRRHPAPASAEVGHEARTAGRSSAVTRMQARLDMIGKGSAHRLHRKRRSEAMYELIDTLLHDPVMQVALAAERKMARSGQLLPSPYPRWALDVAWVLSAPESVVARPNSGRLCELLAMLLAERKAPATQRTVLQLIRRAPKAWPGYVQVMASELDNGNTEEGTR